MRRDPGIGPPAPLVAHLHPHRGFGWGLYGTLTLATFVIGSLGTVTNLARGQFWIAGLIAIGTLAVSGFLALVTFALVWPDLTATATGIVGRMPRGGSVDAGWSEVTVDVDPEGPPGSLRVDIGEDSVSVSARSWVGFVEFVWLLSVQPQATARLTPSARAEVRRMLRIDS